MAEFDPTRLQQYRQAAKEGTGVDVPRSPVEARREHISNMPISREGAEGIARSVIPLGVQIATDMTPLGRVARMGPAVVKAAPYVKDALGGLMGYGANVAAGLEPASTREAVKSAALPPAARGVAGTAKAVMTHLPGTAAIKQGDAVGKIQNAPSSYIPLGADKSDDLYKAVEAKGNPIIPTSHLEKTISEIQTNLANVTHPTLKREVKTALDLANGFHQRIGELKPYGGVPFKELWANSKALSSKLDELEKSGGIEFKDAARLKRAIQEDMSAAGNLTGAGYSELKAANKQYRREQAQKEFTETITKQGFSHRQTPQGEFVEVTPSRVLNWMKHPDQKFWRDSLEPSELKNVEKFLHGLSQVPRMGSGDWMSAAGVAGSAGVLAYRATNDPLLAGAASAAALALPGLIARAVLTPGGRHLVTGLIHDTGSHIPTRALPDMASALRAYLDREPVDAMQREGQTRMPQEP